MVNVFFDIGIAIIAATFVGYLARMFKQPIIPAYIIGGLLVGPAGLRLITDIETIKIISEIGIAFLLFVVGLELDLKKLKDIGLVAVFGGSMQIFILFVIGFILGKAGNGFTNLQAAYIGLMIAFSSTMVVIKLLSDKREVDTLHGRIILGILLMEDIFAIFAIAILSSLGELGGSFVVLSIGKAAILLVLAVALSRILFPTIFKIAAKSKEMLFLTSIATCFLFAIFAHSLGFSIAIGAFLAGVLLANLPYNIEIIGRVIPVRDFFATLFFASLGMQFSTTNLGAIILPLAILTVVVILFKPFLIMVINKMFGYGKRESFRSAISLAQTSEFSLIIMAQGLVLGHVSQNMFTLAIILAMVTISATAYFIRYDSKIYFSLSKYLKPFETRESAARELGYPYEAKEYQAILVGYDRIGFNILQKMMDLKKSLLVIDFNPEIIKRLMRMKQPCIYGDVADLEIIERLNLKHTEIIISTAPEARDNFGLIKAFKKKNRKGLIFVTSDSVDDALELYRRGADYVILPHLLGGRHVALLLEQINGDLSKLLGQKTSHIRELLSRKKLGHGVHRKKKR